MTPLDPCLRPFVRDPMPAETRRWVAWEGVAPPAPPPRRPWTRRMRAARPGAAPSSAARLD